MNKSETRITLFQQIMKKEGLESCLFAEGAVFSWLLDAGDFWWRRCSCVRASTISKPMGEIFPGVIPEMLLYIPANGEAVILCSPHRQAEMSRYATARPVFFDRFLTRLKELGVGRSAGYGENCREMLMHYLKSAGAEDIRSAETLCDDMRMIKDPEEQAIMREGAALNDAAMADAKNFIRPGVTTSMIEDRIAEFGLKQGATDLSFNISVAAAKWEKGFLAPNEPITEGTSIAFDLGFIYKGYATDFGRSLYVGTAPNEVKLAYSDLTAAHLHMLRGIRPGVTTTEDVGRLTAEGFGEKLDRFCHARARGHQIGLECHENPLINAGDDRPLLPGMIFCAEPFVMNREKGYYVRMEDMILVTDAGAESLTKYHRELDEIK